MIESNISRIANIQTLLGSTAKPSFLLWEKVYTKLSSEEDEKWFLRALDEAYKVLAPELKKKDRDNLRLEFLLFLGGSLSCSKFFDSQDNNSDLHTYISLRVVNISISARKLSRQLRNGFWQILNLLMI